MSIKGPVPNQASHANFGLTPVENAEIALVVAGYSDDESAVKMGIRSNTFSSHLETIFKKLNVSDRFELVLCALYYNLAKLDSIQKPSARKSARAHSPKIRGSSPARGR